MGVLLRKMKHSDLPAIARLNAKVFREPYPKLVLSWLRQAFKNRVDGACLVAEDRGRIVGAVFGQKILTSWPDSARITEFFVVNGYRDKGIGKKLFSTCLSSMKKKGVKSVSLFVREKNKRALSLYRKQGFKPFRLMLLRRF